VWGFDIEDQAQVTYIGIPAASVIDAGWNCLEYRYRRNGDPSGWPCAEFWFNGTHTTHANTTPGGGTVAYWNNNIYYAGERARSQKLNKMEIFNTMNANNANSGQGWLDYWSWSTSRVGPG
jgi:hypothetical protein